MALGKGIIRMKDDAGTEVPALLIGRADGTWERDYPDEAGTEVPALLIGRADGTWEKGLSG
jgi:hypothetical protein